MARLPDDPRHADLEDFVAAHFAARQVFVETGVTERDPADILELDVVWTDYNEDLPTRHPVEVKSGQWGLGDLFKFHGWKQYLQLSSGWFICRQLPARVDLASINRLCERLDITLCHIDKMVEVDDRLKALGLIEPTYPSVTELWRYSFWIQRRLRKALSQAIDKKVGRESAEAAKDYFKLINDAVFFEPDVRARVEMLLGKHWTHPKLAKSAAAEISGRPANFEDPENSKCFREALYQGQHYPVQACFYLGHRARLSIVKACADYVIARASGALPPQKIQIFGEEVDLPDNVYHAFAQTADRYADDEWFRKYPLFWQTFLGHWGGFILTDRLEDEYGALSRETGLPVERIDDALDLWDSIFPAGSWFREPWNDCRRVLQQTAAPLRGLGANWRLHLYGVSDYSELGLPGETAERMASDHNSAVNLLDCNDQGLLQ